MNDGIQLNNKRISFSKKVKWKILHDITKGMDPKDAFLRHAFYSFEVSDDKKYVSKLLHKWRKEIYRNREFMYFINQDIDNDMLDDEISALYDEHEFEAILNELQRKNKKF